MAINQHHTAEELNGVKCAVVEKNVSAARAEFLKKILEYNKYTVVIANSPPPKAPPKPTVPPPAAATIPQSETAPTVTATVTPTPPAAEPTPPQPETFTVGVTDVVFNPINAIFGRLLKTEEGRVITLAYWEQKDAVSREAIPYFQKR